MNTFIRLCAYALLFTAGYAQAIPVDGQLDVSLRSPEPGQQQRRLIYDQDSLRILYSDVVRDGTREYFASGLAVPALIAGPVRYRGLQRDLHAAPALPISLDSMFGPDSPVLATDPARAGPVGMVARAGNLSFSVLRVESRWTRAAAAVYLEGDSEEAPGARFVYMRTLLETDESPGFWRLPADYTRKRTLGHLGFELRHRYLRYRFAMPFGATVAPALRMQLGLRLPVLRSSIDIAGLIHTPGYIDAQGRGTTSEAAALLAMDLRAAEDLTVTFAVSGAVLPRDPIPREFRETESTARLRAVFSPAQLSFRGESSLQRETDHRGVAEHAVRSGVSAGYQGTCGSLHAGIERRDDNTVIDVSVEARLPLVRVGADVRRTLTESEAVYGARYFVVVTRDSGTFRIDAQSDEDGTVPLALSWTYSGAIPSPQ